METARHRPAGRGRGGFVGRERELAELEQDVTAALAGRGGLALVGGEPGVGKTRLAEELASRVVGHGVVPLWGRAWDGDGAPPFWPWVQIVRAYLRHVDPRAAAAEIGPVAPWVAQLVPEVRGSLPDVAAPRTPLASDSARRELFDAMTSFLHAAASSRALLLVLDDLHCADAPSLLLLESVARRLGGGRLLVLGTYREVEARRAPIVAETIAALAKQARHVRLGGLSAEEVRSFVAGISCRPAPDGLVRTIHRATGGNPFFVDEVVRLLVAERDPGVWDGAAVASLRVPRAVREAVRRRLEPLPERCRAVLATASLLGHEFELVVLAEACGVAAGDARSLLAPALAAQVLTPAPDSRRHAFAHALVREALYEEIAPSEASRLHRAVGEILERRHADDVEHHLPELAHHFSAAAAAGGAAKAIDYAWRAGDRAMALLAYEEAALQYERALRLLPLRTDAPAELRAGLLLALGEAQNRSGRYAEARRRLTAAAEAARRSGARALLARAALAFANVGPRSLAEPWHSDETVVGLLRGALDALHEGEDALRARLMARLAPELYWAPGGRRDSALLARQAIEIARRLDDPATLAQALLARGISLDGLDEVGERIAIADEILGVPEAERDREHRVVALLWRIGDRFELGDVATLEDDVPAVIRLIDELREPRYLWQARGLEAELALMRGRFAEVERLVPEILAAGAPADIVQAFVGALLFVLRREQGRLAELGATIRAFVADRPEAHAWRAGLAHLLLETGQESAARAEIEAVDGTGFEHLPRDMTWPTVMALLAESCAGLGDARRAARLHELLLPYRARNVLIGDATAFFFGPVTYYLGLLAAATSHLDRALADFDLALEACARFEALPFLTRTRLACAATLLRRGAAGDRERARALVEQARRDARTLGMDRLLASAELLAHRASEPAPARGVADVADVAVDPTRAVFRREGQLWRLEYRGRATRLQDMKGLRILAVLLGHPGESIHALELTGARPWRERALRAESGAGDAGTVLDLEARRQYQRRIEDLRAEIEDAESRHDLGRAERLQAELALLAAEVARAFGLGGRERRVRSAAERARLNATRTIQAAIRRIARDHAELGAHLESTIRTGTFCSYEPDRSPSVDWHL